MTQLFISDSILATVFEDSVVMDLYCKCAAKEGIAVSCDKDCRGISKIYD